MFIIDNTYKSNGGFTGSSHYLVNYNEYSFNSQVNVARFFYDFLYILIVVVLLT